MLKPLLKNTARPFLALKKTNHRYDNLFRKRSRTLCCTRVTLCVKGSWKDLTSMDLTSKLSMKGQKVLVCPKNVSLCVYGTKIRKERRRKNSNVCFSYTWHCCVWGPHYFLSSPGVYSVAELLGTQITLFSSFSSFFSI